MYATIASFLEDWAYESAATAKFIRAITDAARNQRVTPDGRSLGFLAWHVATSIGEIAHTAKIPVEGPHDDVAPEPATMAALADTYEALSAALVKALPKTWTDAMLPETIEMYGMNFTRSNALAMLVKHQAHHRGQMSVLMRQAGLRVPEVYGPAKEDWAQWGMAARK